MALRTPKVRSYSIFHPIKPMTILTLGLVGLMGVSMGVHNRILCQV